jgi:hypothetical protein
MGLSQLLLAFASLVIFGSESLGTRDLILLACSVFRLACYIPQSDGLEDTFLKDFVSITVVCVVSETCFHL